MTMTANMISVAELRELSLNELAEANGGTFTPNTYSKDAYHEVGISTSYHFFDKDEFSFMGKSISYDEANDIVSMARQLSKAINEGHNGANHIGYSESMFINAFNSQLNIKYGIMWDGHAGYDY
ncbi:MAG: hypothetical protein IJ174_08715 [Clostridia bacterium]|nr:hypothetical protein [Clostridia bacterium]